MNDKLHEIEVLLHGAFEKLDELDKDDVDENGLTKVVERARGFTHQAADLLAVCRYHLDDAGLMH